jgi:outer membrane receptor protein involved in Fe transport
VTTGAVTHTLLIGADAYRDRFDSKTTSFVPGPSIDIYRPVYGQVPPLDLSALPLFDQEGLTRWTGAYAQDQLAFGDVDVIVGVRHDRSSARFGAPGTRANDQRFTTPRLGAVWRFAPNQSLYAQFQDGVAANNGRNLAGNPWIPNARVCTKSAISSKPRTANSPRPSRCISSPSATSPTTCPTSAGSSTRSRSAKRARVASNGMSRAARPSDWN